MTTFVSQKEKNSIIGIDEMYGNQVHPIGNMK